ncbi:MAG: hypothetical protein V2B18_15250, partial [Pseudomonadota bacterium]
MSAADFFRSFMGGHGYELTEVVADGKPHRFALPDRTKGDKPGWYILTDGAIPQGWCGDFVSGESFTWTNGAEGRKLTQAERKALGELQARRREEERTQREEAARFAARIWARAKPADPEHPYLKRKQVKAHGLRQARDGRLIVPAYGPDGTLQTVQFIDGEGNKLFLLGGQAKGACFTIQGDSRHFLCEG